MRIIVGSKIQVNITSLTQEILNLIKSDLMFENPEYDYHMRSGNTVAMQYVPQYIHGFQIKDTVIYLPRAYLTTLVYYLRKEQISYRVVFTHNTHKTKYFEDAGHIDLWDYQRDALDAMSSHRDGVLVMPCGSGKTITLLETIKKLGQWTLVLVHTNDLLRQWKEYATNILHKECGIIQGDTVDIKPLTIGMVQTLSKRTLTNRFKRIWGCVVCDEAHHSPAYTFSQLLNELPAKYRYGATATVNRSDRLEGLLFSICGFPRYKIGLNELERLGYIIKPRIICVETNYFGHRGLQNYAKVLNHLTRNKDRLSLILECLLGQREHHNLVLSNRIEHLELMYNMYREIDSRCALLVGKVKDVNRKQIIDDMRVGNIHTIFASTLADEGLDIPILDRLYLTVSTKALGKVEQRIGRIQRVYPGKTDAIVYDFVDSYIPMFDRHFRERLRLYDAIGVEVGGTQYEARRASYQVVRSRSKTKKAYSFKEKVARFSNR